MFGNFGFGGEQRSYSFGCFHADAIPNSLVAVYCPFVPCQLVRFQNLVESTGNVIVGSDRIYDVGNGYILTPGQFSGWIPVENLGDVWHKETDATTYIRYMMVGCMGSGPPKVSTHLLQEMGGFILLEDGGKILI